MSATFTRTQTFTRSDAKYVVSKMAADLYRMQRLYGRPTDTEIENTILEVLELLYLGYLRDVHIGFKRNGNWVVAGADRGLAPLAAHAGRPPRRRRRLLDSGPHLLA